MSPTEKKINELVQEVESGLLKGHITTNVPVVALNYQSKLSGWLSTAMGFIEKLDTLEAQFFVNNRNAKGEDGLPLFKSDTSVRNGWEVTAEGIRQQFWENRIKRLEVLIRAMEKIYYHGREEWKQKELK